MTRSCDLPSCQLLEGVRAQLSPDGALKTSLSLCLLLETDSALRAWVEDREGSHVQAGRASIGYITVWITVASGELTLEFWPVSSSVQRACHGSTSFRGFLVDLLEYNRGIKGVLDHGDGSFSEFFPRNGGWEIEH